MCSLGGPSLGHSPGLRPFARRKTLPARSPPCRSRAGEDEDGAGRGPSRGIRRSPAEAPSGLGAGQVRRGRRGIRGRDGRARAGCPRTPRHPRPSATRRVCFRPRACRTASNPGAAAVPALPRQRRPKPRRIGAPATHPPSTGEWSFRGWRPLGSRPAPSARTRRRAPDARPCGAAATRPQSSVVAARGP